MEEDKAVGKRVLANDRLLLRTLGLIFCVGTCMVGLVCARTMVVIAEHLAEHPPHTASFISRPAFGYVILVPFVAVGAFHGWALMKAPFRWRHVIIPLLCAASLTLLTAMLLSNWTGRLIILRKVYAPNESSHVGNTGTLNDPTHQSAGVAPLTDSKRPGKTSIRLADAFHRRLDALCATHGVYAHYCGALGKHRERGLEPLYRPGEWAIMTVPPQKPGEEAQLHKLDEVLLFRVSVGERPATATRILINLPEGQIDAHVYDIKGKRTEDQEIKELGTTVQKFLKKLEEKDSK